SSSEAARLFRWSLPLLGSMALLYLSGNLVNFVVIYYLKQAQFNIFNAANAFRTLALALPAAIAIPLFPHISSLHKERAFSEIRTRTWQALRYTAMLVIPGVIALVIYRVNFLLILYQKTYIPGAPALAILAISAIPAALSQIIATTLTSIGRTRLEFYITSLQVACLSIVSVLLVQPPAQLGWLNGWGVTGLNGAAMAVLVSSLAALLLNTYFMLTLLGIRIQVTSLVMITASAGASFFAISRLNEYLPVNRYYQLAAAVILGFAVYLAVLSLTGELSKSDVRRVSRSLGLSPRSSEFLTKLCWKESAREVNAVPPSGAKGLAPVESEWEEPPTPRSPPEGPTPPLP
ncbi:MAG TPA: lipopolysaccharide biosynthesis protein, partial [Thermoplasmata archaeon]|nr:lipopolysaccharide biosynthesis protein [Thermoplasmata archaeon]